MRGAIVARCRQSVERWIARGDELAVSGITAGAIFRTVTRRRASLLARSAARCAPSPSGPEWSAWLLGKRLHTRRWHSGSSSPAAPSRPNGAACRPSRARGCWPHRDAISGAPTPQPRTQGTWLEQLLAVVLALRGALAAACSTPLLTAIDRRRHRWFMPGGGQAGWKGGHMNAYQAARPPGVCCAL
jgi:hypothetical protein